MNLWNVASPLQRARNKSMENLIADLFLALCNGEATFHKFNIIVIIMNLWNVASPLQRARNKSAMRFSIDLFLALCNGEATFHKFIIITMILPFQHDSAIHLEEVLRLLDYF